MSQRNNRRTKFETYHSKGYLNIELSLLPPRAQCYKKSHGCHLTRGEKSPMSLSLHGSMLTKTLPRWNCVLHTICSHGRIAQTAIACTVITTLGFSPKYSKSTARHSIPGFTFSPITWLYLLLTVLFVCLFLKI